MSRKKRFTAREAIRSIRFLPAIAAGRIAKSPRTKFPLHNATRRFAHHQVRYDLSVIGSDLTFFQNGVDSLKHNADGVCAHRLHGLANGGEGRSAQGGGGNIVEADYGAVLGYTQAIFAQGPDGAERGHVIESQQSGELPLLFEQVFGQFLTCLKARKRVAGFRQIDDEAGV